MDVATEIEKLKESRAELEQSKAYITAELERVEADLARLREVLEEARDE